MNRRQFDDDVQAIIARLLYEETPAASDPERWNESIPPEIKRYHSDPIFRAKVRAATGAIMKALDMAERGVTIEQNANAEYARMAAVMMLSKNTP